jgi:hypothetical protein
MALDVDPVVAPSAHAAERRHVRARRAVDEQHERDRDAEEEAGQRVEDEDA